MSSDAVERTWRILTPFHSGKQTDWIPDHVDNPRHAFEVVPADYDHDRSRARSGLRDWADYMKHALRGWFAGAGGKRIGFVTAFPQLAVCIGLIKALTFSRRPVVAWMFNMGETVPGLRQMLTSFALRRVDTIVVHSTAEVRQYAAWLGIAESRFHFVPLSIDVQTGPSGPEAPDPFVVAMGTANRDYAVLFEAVAALHLRTVVVAGASAVAGLSVPPEVSVMSGLTIGECHALTRSARVVVIPMRSHDNASGQVTMLEAMQFGKAVIVTRCSGTSDYIVEGESGIFVPPGDADALAAAIRRVWDDPGLQASLGRNARRYVIENSSFAAAAQHMSRLLDATTGTAARRSF